MNAIVSMKLLVAEITLETILFFGLHGSKRATFGAFSLQETFQKPQFVDDCSSELDIPMNTPIDDNPHILLGDAKKNWRIFPAKIRSLDILSGTRN